MNVAIGVWVLLAGGWVLPGDDQDTSAPRAGVYNAGESSDSGSHTRPVLQIPEAQSQMTQPSTRGATRQQSAPGYGPAPRTPSGYGGVSTVRMMPPVPTDSAMRGAGYFPPVPTEFVGNGMMPPVPTMAYRGGGPQPYGTPPGMAGRPGAQGRYMSPTSMSFTQLESRNATGAPAQIGTLANSNTMPSQSKAFTNYQPAPAVSPYQSLFNTGNAGGTINNYTTLVRPQLQQQQQNQQVSTDINGLQTQISPLLPPLSQGQQLSPIPQYNFNTPGSSGNSMGTGNSYIGNGQQPYIGNGQQP